MNTSYCIISLWIFCTWSLNNCNTNAHAQQCRVNEFRCSDGRTCLTTAQLCNTVEDCPSGEDETGNETNDCTKVGSVEICKPREFKCRFGGCVLRDKVCDGVADCWGGTDEAIEICTRRLGSAAVATASVKSVTIPESPAPLPAPASTD